MAKGQNQKLYANYRLAKTSPDTGPVFKLSADCYDLYPRVANRGANSAVVGEQNSMTASFVARPAVPSVFSGVLAVAVVIGIFPGTAVAAEHYYRDAVAISTAPPSKYVIEVPKAAAMHGGYSKVTTDDSGRITRVIFLEDGKAASDTVYTYSDSSSLPSAWQTYKQGTLTGTGKITREASGRPARIDYFTAQGAPTGHTVTTYSADHAEQANYTPDGQRRWHGENYFNADGVLIKSVTQGENSVASRETIYDPLRGLAKSTKQFRNGQLQISYVNTYDNNDDLVRQDLYSDKSVWYGAQTYEHNLLVKKLYKFSNGHTQETVIKYDANRWAERAQFSRDNKLVCTFVQEHLPDGTTKRTIALGPDGSLWAEYPNLVVTEVDQHGHPPNSTAGIIHKAGNWW